MAGMCSNRACNCQLLHGALCFFCFDVNMDKTTPYMDQKYYVRVLWLDATALDTLMAQNIRSLPELLLYRAMTHKNKNSKLNITTGPVKSGPAPR